MSQRYCILLLIGLIGLRLCAVENAAPMTLSLQEAEEMALKSHPKISVATLQALAAHEAEKGARATYFPTVAANVTAVGNRDDNTRLAAGFLNNPSVFERAAMGITVSQVITDFGRTANLAATARFNAKASDQQMAVTRAQIRLQTDLAYFAGLEALAFRRVATETVTSRQRLFDQVSALAANQLRSELDVSFARVSLNEGKLMLSSASNEVMAATARLEALVGRASPAGFLLKEIESGGSVEVSAESLISSALQNRPDLLQLRLQRDAAARFSLAEKALSHPVISAMGGLGLIPIHDSRMQDSYAAAGVNLNLPLFTGGLYHARQREAELKAAALEANLKDAENSVIRDVRIAWLSVNNAVERRKLSRELLENATKSFALAQARYNAGSSSMVELGQAELARTSAEIALSNANYDLLAQESLLSYQSGTWH